MSGFEAIIPAIMSAVGSAGSTIGSWLPSAASIGQIGSGLSGAAAFGNMLGKGGGGGGGMAPMQSQARNFQFMQQPLNLLSQQQMPQVPQIPQFGPMQAPQLSVPQMAPMPSMGMGSLDLSIPQVAGPPPVAQAPQVAQPPQVAQIPQVPMPPQPPQIPQMAALPNVMQPIAPIGQQPGLVSGDDPDQYTQLLAYLRMSPFA